MPHCVILQKSKKMILTRNSSVEGGARGESPTHPSNSQTTAECPTIPLKPDTIHPEIASDTTG